MTPCALTCLAVDAFLLPSFQKQCCASKNCEMDETPSDTVVDSEMDETPSDTVVDRVKA